MTKWTPGTCDVHGGPAIRVFFKVRTLRMVDGRRTCAACACKPDIRWLVMRAYRPWLSNEVVL